MKTWVPQLIYEEVPIGIVFISPDYRVIRVNKEIGKRFGAAPRSFHGKFCYLAFKQGERPCPDCPGAVAMETGIPWEVERTVWAEDGSIDHIVHNTAYPWYDSQERLQGFLELSLDVTLLRLAQERERVLQERLNSEKAETLHQVAIGLSHRVNNSLASILLNLNLLQHRIPASDESALILLGKCEAEVQKVTSIMDRLSEITQPVVTDYLQGVPMINIEESLKKLEQED